MCTVQGPKLWITMEYLSGGSVADLLKAGPLEEMYVVVLLHEIINGLAYLHSEHKIHRDIKGTTSLLIIKFTVYYKGTTKLLTDIL